MDTLFLALKQMRVGLLLSILTIILGYLIGGGMGGADKSIKNIFKTRAENVVNEHYQGDIANAEDVLAKSWSYLKRSHLHASALGTSSLACIIFLAFLPLSNHKLFFTSLSLGIGALGYSLYWMFAGFLAPSMGSPSAAKEALRMLAIPSAGLCIIGIFLVAFYCISCLFQNRKI